MLYRCYMLYATEHPSHKAITLARHTVRILLKLVLCRSLPNSRFFALTFQKKCCRPSSWPRRTAARLMTKTARRVADPLRELGSKHMPRPRCARQLKQNSCSGAPRLPGGPYTSAKQMMPRAARGGGEDEAFQADRR